MDEQRTLCGVGGSLTQVESRDSRALRPYRVWPFSGIVVCAGCGSRLHAAAARNGASPNYHDTARQRNVPCPDGGHRNVRAEELDAAFAELISRPVPKTWRADIAAVRAELAADADWDVLEARRAQLVSERDWLKLQHRYGLVTDVELLRQVDRIRLAIEALPVRDDEARDLTAQASACQTIAVLAGYWSAADLSERAEMVWLRVLPEGLCYDLARKQIVAVQPRTSLIAPLRLVCTEWRADNNGWLVQDVEPAEAHCERRGSSERGAHSSA
jgi:hypothetical protein